MPTITYQAEPWSDALRDEARPLLERHWEEVALDQEMVPLDPRWDLYETFESTGMLSITTVRQDGALVGYASFLLVPNAHYRSLRVAENDIFWLAPECRRGGIGLQLLRAGEAECRARGANKIILKEKVHRPLGRLFEHLGYRHIENIYAKAIR